MKTIITKLSVKQKLGYGAGEFSSSLFWIVIGFWLMNYMTDELGLAASLAGTAVLVGKLWDAVTDPIVGQLSDRTSTRWGRRRPWFLFSAIPFGLCFFMMFFNVEFTGQTKLFVWVTLMFMLLCTAYTCANIPYNALLAELTPDYNERSSLSGYKSVFAVLATLVGAGLAQPIMGMFNTSKAGFMGIGAVFGALIAVSVLIPFFFAKEQRSVTDQTGAHGFFKKNVLALKNKPFRFILYTWVANTVGITLITASLVYYFKYILGDETLMTMGTLIMMVTSFAFIPVTVKASKVLSKNKTYAYGMLIFVASLMAMFFAGHVLGVVFVYFFMFLAGIGMSTHYVMPWSIVPDTIDYGFVKLGVKQEGVYYGLWSFTIKIGQALASFFLGLVLSAFGYVADTAQSALSLLGIRLVIGPIASVFLLVGVYFLFKYPLSKDEHIRIKNSIDDTQN